MDRKPLAMNEKPPSYGISGPSTATEEILFLIEAIVEVDKFTDFGNTPAILFHTPTNMGGTGDFYTYKKLTTIHHQFHDKYRCHMHLVGINPNTPGLDARRLEEQISWQALSREVESAKLGERVAVEVKRVLIIWKGEESRVRRHGQQSNPKGVQKNGDEGVGGQNGNCLWTEVKPEDAKEATKSR
ncbi:hypothetical protein IFR04_010619 [Cadophora malorum]|uniref:Uncharacterized protein n=1 Tax=Cadophora malorum TaxID=108018 RepID=A0A8H7TCG3_9HELO|nr:hypothetical protein IFR04_010619 [Cadophora malorum]